ncbi:MAG: non-canonical purine NTP diphosphatase [Flammeovirgaceae bacterium]
MKNICFATNNLNKLKELQKILEGQYQVLGLKDIGCEVDIPETSDTIEGNSLLKAQYVWEHYKMDCFADDTGLEITALNGEPGVYSARYAGPAKDAKKNIAKVLGKLINAEDRSAQFKTVITLIQSGEVTQFEGIVAGNIREEVAGTEGFGYDPVFEPTGYQITFAEMSMTEKNAISHRGKAVQLLVDYLKSQAE